MGVIYDKKLRISFDLEKFFFHFTLINFFIMEGEQPTEKKLSKKYLFDHRCLLLNIDPCIN